MLKRLGEIVPQGDESRMAHSAYELCVGSEVFTTDEKVPTRLAPGEIAEISPGQFALVLTEETIAIPADALGLISIRFSLKEQGLVNVSGFHVDPGFTGRLYFAVFNASGRPILLQRGRPAFLLWLADLGAPTDKPYIDGKHTLHDGLPASAVSTLRAQPVNLYGLDRKVADMEERLTGTVTTARLLVAICVGIAAICATLSVFLASQVLGATRSPAAGNSFTSGNVSLVCPKMGPSPPTPQSTAADGELPPKGPSP